MALEKKDLAVLMSLAATADSSAATSYSFNNEAFSAEEINKALREGLAEYTKTYSDFRNNQNLIFELIEQTIDVVLPKKVEINYNQFAEIKQFAQGDKPIFHRKLDNKTRAKQFITRVGHAGRYETFKLGKSQETFEVPTSAVGGAARIGFEEFLDGRVNFAELTAIVMEGIDDLIYKEIAQQMQAGISQLPDNNKVIANGFDEASFDQLLMIAETYGAPTIYCTKEFAVRFVPTEGWKYSEEMKNELRRTGMLAGYKGYNVVVLPQAFTDATHEEKLIDPSFCWIIPNGHDTKPVKVAFEGGTLVREVDNNDDWSKDVQVYKKVGVVTMMTPDICVYEDTSLTKYLRPINDHAMPVGFNAFLNSDTGIIEGRETDPYKIPTAELEFPVVEADPNA